MSRLFDLSETEPPNYNAKVDANSVLDNGPESVHVGNVERKIQEVIGKVNQGDVCSFWSNGDWSLYELVFHLLKQTGAGTEIYLATWSISELSARKLTQWMEEGLISKLVGVIDFRSKNRHPAAYHLSKNTFSKIRVAYCHSKVTVLHNNGIYITINGSANWTENPRLESGVIINSEITGKRTVEIIQEIVDKGEFGLEPL